MKHSPRWRRPAMLGCVDALVALCALSATHLASGQTGRGAARRMDHAALRLTFADDFDAFRAAPDGRDRATGHPVWRTTYHWSGGARVKDLEAQYYSDATVGTDPFAVRGGVLHITAAPAGGGKGALPDGATYTSGLITTQASFSQQYGYFEMRAKLPAGRGFWPAFWLLPNDLSWPPEIDVVEVLGHDPTTLHVTAHYVLGGRRKLDGVCSADCGKAGAEVKVPDTSLAFHTYGVSWRPDAIRWYFDNVEVFSAPTPADMHQPMYILANLAVGKHGSWPGPADGASSATLLIDHIKAYQFDDLVGSRIPVRR